MELTLEAWFTLGILISVFVALVWNWAPPDVLFLGSTVLLAGTGIITAEEAFAGFSNHGMLTVAMLFIAAAGLRETGVLEWIGHYVLGGATTERSVLFRLSLVILPLSAFLNNTPIVAMFVPIVLVWCRRNETSPSKLLIPVSYLAILGGTCTLIGTSTNLVIHGLMKESGRPALENGLAMFELAWVGVPYALIGMVYLLVFAPRLLPERKELLEQLGDTRREYLAEMLVAPGCRLAGKTVFEGGLRNLPGLFLIEIDRNGTMIAPVSPDDKVEVGDRLVFTGVVSSIIELEKIPGLVPAADPAYEVAPQAQRGRQLVEAVVSESSPLIGKSIREADFRASYNAAVVAVHRGGQRVETKVGAIRLRPGDTLLLQTRPHFQRAHRNDSGFYLISNVDEWRPIRWDRAWPALGIFALLITLMTTGMVNTLVAATASAVLMVGFGCLSAGDARRSIDWQVLITIAAAFGVGTALEKSGVAEALASVLVNATAPLGIVATLAAVYLAGWLVTELITNNAAAVLLFPICLKTAEVANADPRPFLIALVLAASASFVTPIGYQTNMMVYGPGGYRFLDFARIGLPLHVVLWIVAVILVPIFWPPLPT
jgi:di/tricarboxylate transporter